MKILTDELVLKYAAKRGPLPLRQLLDKSPERLTEYLKPYINGMLHSYKIKDTEETGTNPLTAATLVAERNKDVLLAWAVPLCINGAISLQALEALTASSVMLLELDSNFDFTLDDLGDTSVFYSFAKQVMPELTEAVVSKPTLFYFRENFDMPKKLMSLLQTCIVLAELNTFPDYDRYNIDVEINPGMALDITYGLSTFLHLAHMSTLLYLIKGETEVARRMALWTKQKTPYIKVFKAICTLAGVVNPIAEEEECLH